MEGGGGVESVGEKIGAGLDSFLQAFEMLPFGRGLKLFYASLRSRTRCKVEGDRFQSTIRKNFRA